MPVDFAAYTVLAVTAVVLAVALVLGSGVWVVLTLVRLIRAHNTQALKTKAKAAAMAGGYVVLDEEDSLDEDGITALMDHAAGVVPIVITRPEGEQ